MTPAKDLRVHFELRKTRPLAPRPACARVFELEGQAGLVDASGALWPVDLGDSGLRAGTCGRMLLSFFRPDGASVSKYDDAGFVCRVVEVREDVPRAQGATWSLAGLPAPGPADALAAVRARAAGNAAREGMGAGTLFLESAASKRARLVRARNRALARARDFFEGRGFLHCDTPTLTPSGGVETYLDAFTTHYVDHRGGMIALQLPTSPEFALKKLLVEGHARVFQLARAYRNGGELSRWHEPEFTMLEWYRSGAALEDVMEDTRRLVFALADALGSTRFGAHAAEHPWPAFRVEDLFRDRAGLELRDLQEAGSFARAACDVSPSARPDDDWDTTFHKVFLDLIEPFLATLPACFVTAFPMQMAALARKETGTPFADRFEAYLFGIEICNGYQELTDAAELLGRFAGTAGRRGEDVARDPIFEGAMAYGLPPCAGNALGFERVVGLLLGLDGLASLLPLPFLSQFPRGWVAAE